MEMEESEEAGHENMDFCPVTEEKMQCDEHLKDLDLNGLKTNCNGSNTTMNNMIDHVSDENHQNACGEVRPPKEFLPVLVDVWTRMPSEIRQAYKIFRELIIEKNKSIVEPFLDAVDSSEPGLSDYYEKIKEPVDLFQISEKFHHMEYTSITPFAADLRQMIENCYRYNGVDSYVSKQAFKLETILEQKFALLSRELRDKTSIAATNIAKNKEYLNGLLFTPGSRRLSRKPKNGDSSQIALQVQLQDELREKEKKRLKEKEKKELNEALEGELELWWQKISTSDSMIELLSTWEVPSVGIFIFILKDFLNLQDLNYTEFELGTLFPDKSLLMARIFTSLLVTPFQRSKLNRKEPMEYSVWENKVNTKISSWYKMAASRGQEYAASLFGFDPDLFDVLGYVNPFESLRYHQLSLKQRMWIMKALCEAALEQDSEMRDHFADLDFLDRQDLCLGSDSDGFSYHYFTAFGATDIRIYKQKAFREPVIRTIRNQTIVSVKQEPVIKNEDDANVKPKMVTEKDENKPNIRTSNRIKVKKNLSPEPEKTEKKTNEHSKEFELVVSDIHSLSMLVKKVSNARGMKGQRRAAEKDLFQTLEALLIELEKREASLLKCSQRARLKIMRECRKEQEHSSIQNEVKEKPRECWGSDDEDEDEEETEADSANTQIVESSVPIEIPEIVPQTSNLNDVSKHSPVLSVPEEVLNKGDRHLRKKRFDVKQLFSDHELPRKRQKIETVKSANSNEHYRNTDPSKTVTGEIFSQTLSIAGSNNNVSFTREHEISVSKSQLESRVSSSVSGKTDKTKFRVEENSVLIKNLKHKSKHKKSKKKKKSLKKYYDLIDMQGTELTPEKIAVLKLKRKIMQREKVKKEKKLRKTTQDNNPYFSYDGLKALADIASLVQNNVSTAQQCSKSVEATTTNTSASGSHNKRKLSSEGQSKDCTSNLALSTSNDTFMLPSSNNISWQNSNVNNSSSANFLINNFQPNQTDSSKDRQQSLQWKRPNILRKSKPVITISSPVQGIVEQVTTKSTDIKEICSHSGDDCTMKTSLATSPVASLQYQTKGINSTSGENNITNTVAKSDVTVISQDGKYIVCSNLSNNSTLTSSSYNTTNRNTTAAVSEQISTQYPTLKGIPMAVQNQAKPAGLLTNAPQAQPIMLLSGTQALLQPESQRHKAIPSKLVANCQPNLNGIVQQPRALTLHQQTPSVSTLTGSFLSEAKKDGMSTKYPVITLKSKLHAAALKKRYHCKGKLEPSNIYPLIVPQPVPKVPIAPLPDMIQSSTKDAKSKIQIVKESNHNFRVSDGNTQVATPKVETILSNPLPVSLAGFTLQNPSNSSDFLTTSSVTTVTLANNANKTSTIGNTVKSFSNINQNYPANQENSQMSVEIQRTKSIQIIKSPKEDHSKAAPSQLIIAPKREVATQGMTVVTRPVMSAIKQHPQLQSQSISIIKHHHQPETPSVPVIKQHIHPQGATVSIVKQHPKHVQTNVSVMKQHHSPQSQNIAIIKQHPQPMQSNVSIMKQQPSPQGPSVSIVKQHHQPVQSNVSIIKQQPSPQGPSVSIVKQHHQPVQSNISITKQQPSPQGPSVPIVKQHHQPVQSNVSIMKQQPSPQGPSVSIVKQHHQAVQSNVSIMKQQPSPQSPSVSIVKHHHLPVQSSVSIMNQHPQPQVPIVSIVKQHPLSVSPKVSPIKQHLQPGQPSVSIMKQYSQQQSPTVSLVKQHAQPKVPTVSIIKHHQLVKPNRSLTKQHPQTLKPNVSNKQSHLHPQSLSVSTVKHQSQPAKPSLSVIKQHIFPGKTSILHPIKPAIQPTQSKQQTMKSNQAIFITPARFSFDGAYPAAIPIAPMPAPLLQIPNAFPTSISGCTEIRPREASNKTVATQVLYLPTVAPAKQSKLISITEMNQLHYISKSSTVESVKSVTTSISSMGVMTEQNIEKVPLQKTPSCSNVDNKSTPSVSLNISEIVLKNATLTQNSVSNSEALRVRNIVDQCRSPVITSQISEEAANSSMINEVTTKNTYSLIQKDIGNQASCFDDQSKTETLPVTSDNSFVTFSIVSPIPCAGVSSLQNADANSVVTSTINKKHIE